MYRWSIEWSIYELISANLDVDFQPCGGILLSYANSHGGVLPSWLFLAKCTSLRKKNSLNSFSKETGSRSWIVYWKVERNHLLSGMFSLVVWIVTWYPSIPRWESGVYFLGIGIPINHLQDSHDLQGKISGSSDIRLTHWFEGVHVTEATPPWGPISP